MLLKRRRGMVLSLAIVIMVILLVLATAVTSMGTGNLNFAMGQMNNERAYQAAEAGLSYAYTDISMGTIFAGGPQTLPPQKIYAVGPNGDQATVTFYDNRLGTTAQPPGCPTPIPNGYIYLVASGQLMTANHITTEKKVGAMICLGGGGQMSYGVNCQAFQINQGVLTAYDLKNAQEVGGYPVAASNTTSAAQGIVELGTGVVNKVDVRGDVVLSAGVPSTGIVQGNYLFQSGNVQNLASPLNFPETKVPVLAPLTAPSGATMLGSLPSGHYTNLDISSSTRLSGRYVVDSLNFSPGGSFRVTTGDAAELYVQSLTTSNLTPVFNHSGSSNHLKVYYQGSAPLTLNLDSNSHLSLVAPKASVTIQGTDLTMGAFAAQAVNIVMDSPTSRFCYDPTSAQPIRTSASATSTGGQIKMVVTSAPTNAAMNNSASGNSNNSSSDSIESLIPGFQAITVVGRQRF